MKLKIIQQAYLANVVFVLKELGGDPGRGRPLTPRGFGGYPPKIVLIYIKSCILVHLEVKTAYNNMAGQLSVPHITYAVIEYVGKK